MVKVIVYAEGGVLPSLHDEALANAVTLGNSASLRQSFNRIFSEAASRSDIMVEVDMRSSNKKTAKDFISCSNNTSALYVDYDKKDDIWSILNSYTGNLAALQERVFYMVQAMEAWFLKQPECIVRWSKICRYNTRDDIDELPYYNDLDKKNPEDFPHPDLIVNSIISHYFSKGLSRSGKVRKLKYNKLNIASQLLDMIDVTKLMDEDAELKRFANYIAHV